MSKDGVKPSKKNVASIIACLPPKTYTNIQSFTGVMGHYRHFIKGFAHIAAPLYDLINGYNKDKKSEPVKLSPEALEAFNILKEKCVNTLVLSFPDFKKPFLLETDTSGKGLGAVLSQKQDDGRYHPVAYASQTMNETEQRYHSNKQEFLALKWAVTEQFHEYLTPYGKNKNEFVVRMDNNPLTYIFSSAHLNATGHRWVASLANYNFSLEYQKGKVNTVADFLSCMEDCLPEEEVEEVLRRVKIPAPRVKAMLDNADTPITERAEGVGEVLPIMACLAKTLSACPVKYTTLQVVDWKKAQREDPVLNTLIKNLRSSKEDFMRVMCKVLNLKAARAYEKQRHRLILKNGLFYHKTHLTKTGEDLWCFIVPKSHRGIVLDGSHHEAAHQGQCCSISLMQEHFLWPGMSRDMINKVRNCAHCKKYEGAPPIAKLQKLPCSGPGELLHINFTMIEETVGLHKEPVIRNALIMQDHFSKYIVAYVVEDQKARTAAEVLCSGYFGLFRAPAYLLSDKGKSFTATVVEDLCTLYGVKKLRTSSYHAQTNGQVERMNQTLIHLIGKLDKDKKACWSKHLLELLMAYNSTCLVVTGYSPHFLLFGRRLRITVDYLFPTL